MKANILIFAIINIVIMKVFVLVVLTMLMVGPVECWVPMRSGRRRCFPVEMILTTAPMVWEPVREN